MLLATLHHHLEQPLRACAHRSAWTCAASTSPCRESQAWRTGASRPGNWLHAWLVAILGVRAADAFVHLLQLRGPVGLAGVDVHAVHQAQLVDGGVEVAELVEEVHLPDQCGPAEPRARDSKERSQLMNSTARTAAIRGQMRQLEELTEKRFWPFNVCPVAGFRYGAARSLRVLSNRPSSCCRRVVARSRASLCSAIAVLRDKPGSR